MSIFLFHCYIDRWIGYVFISSCFIVLVRIYLYQALSELQI